MLLKAGQANGIDTFGKEMRAILVADEKGLEKKKRERESCDFILQRASMSRGCENLSSCSQPNIYLIASTNRASLSKVLSWATDQAARTNKCKIVSQPQHVTAVGCVLSTCQGHSEDSNLLR